MPPKRKVKRKDPEIIVNKVNKIDDKRKLLQALKDHGASVIHDWNLLQKSYFPTKSLPEIKFLISTYERKGKELSSRENFIDSFPERKNIAQWYSIVSNCVPSPAKQNDMSRILKDVFEKMGKQFSSSSTSSMANNEENGDDEVDDDVDEEVEVDYRAVHSYFCTILDGRFPAKLENRESAVVLSIMNNLMEMVESLGKSDEKIFLTSGAWWKSAPAITNEVATDSQNDEVSTDNHSLTSQNINENGQDTHSGNDNPDQPEYYADLPRIRRVPECFNPLKIPTSILDENHNLMTAFLI